MRRIVTLVWAIVLLQSGFLYATDYVVSSYTRHQGLPQDYIYTILQDKKEYLWIGTGNGLTRFDGKNFLLFKQNNGLQEDFITSSCVLPSGTRLFSHFNGGLSSYYNGKIDVFTKKSLTKSSINTLFVDAKTNIWAGTREGELIVFGPSNTYTKKWLIGEYESILFIDSISSGNLLVGTNSHLYLVNSDPKAKQNIVRMYDSPKKAGVKNISRIRRHEWLLLTEDNEMFLIKETKGILQFSPLNVPTILAPVFAYSTGNGKFWTMMDNGDWQEHKLVGNQATLISWVKNSLFSADIVPNLVFEDKEGNIWIGTFGKGLLKLSIKRSNIYTLDMAKPANVSCMLASSTGDLLLGSSNGVFQWSKERRGFVRLPQSFLNQGIASICEISKDNFLVATNNSKLLKWNKKDQKAPYWVLPITEQDKITQVIKDSSSNIWIATSSGAIVFDKEKGKFKLLTMEDGLAHNYVYTIFPDSKGRVWFGTHKSGLSYYHNNKIHTLKSPLENSGLDISCFAEDNNGNIWMGTSGQGIFILAENNTFVKGISTADGLVSDYVYFLQKDLSGTIWVGHKNGLSRILSSNSGYLISDYSQYIQNLELTQASYSITPVNDVWIGGQNVCVRLNVNPDNKIPEGSFVDISNLKLNYDEIDWSHKDVNYNNETPDNVDFKYNENLLTFTFNGISFSYNDKLRYQYKLEGFDDNWSLLTEQNFVTYNKLPAGKYTFLVKARNYAGLWSPMPTAMHFTINPPYWETWWFRALFVISVVVFIYSVIKVRTANLKKRNQALEVEKIKLEKEIRERKLAENRLLKSELNLKNTNQELNTLIYRASHDLRGPVSTISGLVNVANIRIQDTESISFFSMINTSVHKLDQILKKLFLVSEIKQSDLQPEVCNIKKMVENVLDTYTGEIEHKEIKILLDTDQDTDFILDAKLFETIVKNIIDNALIYGRKHGSEIKIKIWQEDHTLHLSFYDNGKGIKQEHLEKVFDMFYKASDLSKGNGLGLYIVKKAVVLMGGEVDIHSVENEYTEVNMSIPELQNL